MNGWAGLRRSIVPRAAAWRELGGLTGCEALTQVKAVLEAAEAVGINFR